MTHDQDEALSIADRVAVLHDGKIAQCATPAELYSHPVDADLAAFIGEANLIEGSLDEDGMVKTSLGNLAISGSADPGPVTVLIRPEQIEFDDSEGSMPARVISYGYHGHDAVVRVRPEWDQGPSTSSDPSDPSRMLTVRVIGGNQLVPGTRVRLRVRDPVQIWPKPDAG